VGLCIAQIVKNATNGSASSTFKDPKHWGVTDIDDVRLAKHSFGDYKSPERLQAEVQLSNYLNEYTQPRFIGASDGFTIALAAAAPGSGKSRLLDDAVRGQIAAEVRDDVVVRQFDPTNKLLFAITFNCGTTTLNCAYPLGSRCALEFFCGQSETSADLELEMIDRELARLLPSRSVSEVEEAVLDALEALFFHGRGDGSLGRTVLFVDEIGLARAAETTVYHRVVDWIGGNRVRDARGGHVSRRGAVFTDVKAFSEWAITTPSERSIVRLGLGLFDVWDPQVQRAIMLNVNAQPLWSNVKELPPKVWSLFASTGGRPRDIETILLSMSNPKDRKDAPVNDLDLVSEHRLMRELCRIDAAGEDATFCRYLLPSMLGLQFLVKRGLEVTRFGLDVASRALLNADLLSTKIGDSALPTPAQLSAAPAVSLRFAERLPGSLQSVFGRLVADTTFYELRGDGKDFEHIWVQLLQTHLMLQHRVRVGGDRTFFGRMAQLACRWVVPRARLEPRSQCSPAPMFVSRHCSRQSLRLVCTRRATRRSFARSCSIRLPSRS
jgi:hypothetical protein